MRFFAGLAAVLLFVAPASAGGLRIYSDEVTAPVFERVLFGYERSDTCTVGLGACTEDTDCNDLNPNDVCGVGIDFLNPGSQTDIWDLVCNPATPGGNDCQTTSWDFSGVNLTNYPGMAKFATTIVPVDATETCSSTQCGFTGPGKVLAREDRAFDTPSPTPTLTVQEFEDRSPQDHTVWLRGGVRNEGISGGGLGLSESRICHETEDRSSVPLWQFPHCDGQGCFMQLGDSWEPENPSTGVPQAFQCEKNVFNHVCPSNCGLFCQLYAYSCSSFLGQQVGEVVNEGNVTLPSGHTFKSLVVQSNAEFCLALFSSCGNSTQNVRTVLYLWVVPNLTTVVRLQSRTLADSTKDFNAGEDLAAEMDVKFGPLPPLSITPGTITDTSVQLSWDPGLITDHIDGYRVYWDTDSGNDSAYAFDSVNNQGQVAFAGPSATISGLTPGTTYYFTITTVSDYTDPTSTVTTTYESTLFPKQIPAVPVDLPLEVQLPTTGGAVAGAVPDGDDRPGVQLTVDKGAGSALDLSWGASCKPDTDYGVYEGPLGSFASHLADTCTTLGLTAASVTPAGGDRFFVVVPSNGSAEGSYGLTSAGAERATSAAACDPQNIGVPVCP